MASIPIETGAGPLREYFAFDKRTTIQDPYGNTQGDWEEQFRAAAGLVWLTGGEAVRAARLEGIQPISLTIRNGPRAAMITPDWRCRDLRTGKVYAIKAVAVRQNRSYRDLIAVEGEAA